ncbi:MAG: hypothetical protein GX053_13965 [Tissierella sp.]|nr:hypothetical protein [Tissierella sp.]
MLSSKGRYLDNKGFFLLEILLSVSLICILLSSVYSIVRFTYNTTMQSDEIDTALLNGRYAIEYIKDEVMSADKIYFSSRFTNLDYNYPKNIGFVIMEKELKFGNGKIDSINYNYRTYYQKNDELIRIAYNTPNDSLFEGNLFSGHNQICSGIISFEDSNLDIGNNVVNLSIHMAQGNGSLSLETTINLRCPIE